MTTPEILEKYINYYKNKKHALIPNVSLIPEGDPTLLFVNSGMFPLVPYLSGEPHPLGKRLVNVQRSLRFDDIDEIGDATHTMAFHMIGNWSLGDYFKQDQIPWVYNLLINEYHLDPQKIYATVFAGDESAPKDVESISLIKEIFKNYGIEAKEGERIFPYGKENNWWKRGDAVGELGGPDSEIFYFIGEGTAKGKTPATHEDEFIEIGNSVFMQYKKTEKGWEELPQKNVDFGGGLERIAMVVQGKKDIFETDTFWPIILEIQKTTGKDYYSDTNTQKYMRILADHFRVVCLLIMDGVTPSNRDQGYILRRILRKMFRAGKRLGQEENLVLRLIPSVEKSVAWLYPEIKDKEEEIAQIIKSEEEKFNRALKSGIKISQKLIAAQIKEGTPIKEIAQCGFNLFQSLGYPLELFCEDLSEAGIDVKYLDLEKEFECIFAKHQEGSRSGAEMKFKGGLADQSENTIKYHTVTHLLQRALKKVLGDQVCQIGSNITNERLRFDFPCGKKLSETEISQVENMVNDEISKGLDVNFVILPKEEALKTGALHLKNEKYPEMVKVYYIGNSIDSAISKEFCGGPHVDNTSKLGKIRIMKQESIGEGKYRVYAKFI